MAELQSVYTLIPPCRHRLFAQGHTLTAQSAEQIQITLQEKRFDSIMMSMIRKVFWDLCWAFWGFGVVVVIHVCVYYLVYVTMLFDS